MSGLRTTVDDYGEKPDQDADPPLSERIQTWMGEAGSLYDWAQDNERAYLIGNLTRNEFQERLTDARIKRYLKRNPLDKE